jgi:lysophospholipase L1-like esterase
MFCSEKKTPRSLLLGLCFGLFLLPACTLAPGANRMSGPKSGAATSTESAAAAPVPLRVLPVGDSITQGGKRDRAEHTYRLPLQRLLRERGVAFDFLGTRAVGLHEDAVWPEVLPGVAFDRDHAGYYGRKTAFVCAKVIEALPAMPVPPNVVLVHLGTNDQGSTDFPAEVVAPLRDLILALRRREPKVAVFLGHLNFNDSKGANALRPLVEDLANEMSTAESPVVTVHHYQGWQEKPRQPNSDTFDWAHPNPQGQEKMARAWLAALEPELQRLGWAVSAAIDPVDASAATAPSIATRE